MVSIRVANRDDATVLTELGRQTFHDTFAAHNKPEDMGSYMEKAFTVEKTISDIEEPGSVCLLAEDASKVIGFARLAPETAPPCITAPAPVRLIKLYVSATAIGSGVGAALMRASFEWAKKAGHKSVWLGVWEHNHRAKAFYERRGLCLSGRKRSGSGVTTRRTC
jgi:GNAT superfamily N-acetyltransferase